MSHTALLILDGVLQQHIREVGHGDVIGGIGGLEVIAVVDQQIQEQVGGAEIYYEYCSGNDFPKDLSGYRLVIQCGGCMLNEREVKHRYRLAKEQGIPMTNYGVAISEMKGILKRSIANL